MKCETEIECVECLEPLSENVCAVSGLETEKTKICIGNTQNDVQSNMIIQRNVPQKKKFCKDFNQFMHRLNSLCTWEVPWIMILVSTVQIVVFFVACDDSVALLTFKPRMKQDLWRFFTYNTIHYSTSHLLLNTTFQILIGYPLETEQGHCRILIVYTVGVIFGAIGSMLFKTAESIIGSSAGVYSILLSHISQCILNWNVISYRNLRLISVSMLFIGDLLFSVLRHFFWNNEGPKISIAAHFCGGISGFFVGLIIFRKLQNKSRLYNKNNKNKMSEPCRRQFLSTEPKSCDV